MFEQIFTATFLASLTAATVRMALPLIYAGLGETVLEKAGMINIGMEGVMLSGAFFSFLFASITGNIGMGIVGGMVGGIIVSMIHGILSIRCLKDQSVSGIALNLFFLGFTSFMYKLVFGNSSYSQITTLQTIKIPLLSQIPLIGEAFFNQDIMAYTIYILILLSVIIYKKTALGMIFTSIGENPSAAESAGINVIKARYIACGLNGILGGLGGAYLVLVQLGTFNENMTSGRGYIVLSAVILGRYTPLGMFGACLIFGFANALQIRLQAVGVPIPSQALAMLPYLITLITLVGAIGKKSAPESLGKPYVRGAR